MSVIHKDKFKRISKVTVFCPRGCNQISVNSNEPWDECGACGQRMTAAAEESYFEGLILSGQYYEKGD